MGAPRLFLAEGLKRGVNAPGCPLVLFLLRGFCPLRLARSAGGVNAAKWFKEPDRQTIQLNWRHFEQRNDDERARGMLNHEHLWRRWGRNIFRRKRARRHLI